MTSDLWPLCPKCGGKMGFAFYAICGQGYEFCSGCWYRVEAPWIKEVLLAGLKKLQSQERRSDA